MRRVFHSLLLLLALPLSVWAAGELSNRPAPPFTLPDSQGRRVSLSDFKGKFLIIEFLSTTCPHCQKLAPVLESLRERFKGRLALLAIAAHPDSAATVAQFINSYKVAYPILLDSDNRVVTAYLKPGPPRYSFSIPHLFLVDRTGHLRDDFSQNPSNAELFTIDGLGKLLEGYLGRRE